MTQPLNLAFQFGDRLFKIQILFLIHGCHFCKDFWLIMTAAENNRENMRPVVEGFRGFLNCLDDAREKGIIYGLGAWKAGEITTMPAMQEAYNAGKSIK